MINYNYDLYIEQALEAIFSQSRLPDEFIIIDDASTDNSVEIIERMIKEQSFVKFIKHEQNKGCLDSVRHACRLVTKDYVYSAASDDFILPGFFEKTMSFIEKNDLTLCCSIPRFFNENNTFYDGQVQIKKNTVFTSNELVAFMKKTHFWIPGHTTIVSQEALRNNEWYDKNLCHHSDFYLLHKIAFQSKSGLIAESLSCLRCHSNSFSRNENYKEFIKPVQLKLLKKINSLDKELRQRFKESRLLSHLQWTLVKTIIKKPFYWHYLFSMKSDVISFVVTELQKKKIKYDLYDPRRQHERGMFILSLIFAWTLNSKFFFSSKKTNKIQNRIIDNTAKGYYWIITSPSNFKLIVKNTNVAICEFVKKYLV